MDSRTVERIERWDARPFESGYETLDSLASADFSGAVTAGGAWLFMLNGRIVGIEDGRLEDFEHTTGSIYEAPDPGVPLLMAMQAEGGEQRAKYYTEKTALASVDETLQDGGFTGYVELSEDVLSGDYYLIYYGGRRMAAAWVGAAERLVTDREAFERAADEVGIYRVIDVTIDVRDVPEVESSDPVQEEVTTPSGAGQVRSEESPSSPQPESAPEEPAEPSRERSEPETQSEPDPPSETHSTAPADDTSEPPSDSSPTVAEAMEAAEVDLERESARPDDPGDERFEQEAEWRESRSIPSIDPESASSESPSQPREEYGTVDDAFDPDILEREDEIDRLTQQIDELDVRREVLEEENEELAAEVERLRTKNAELEQTVEELEARLAKQEATESTEPESTLTPAEALAATNVFVRYHSKSEPTLEAAHGGEGDRSAVRENLRLDYHTTFDDSGAVVAGEPFETFLEGTMAHRFVTWLSETALFEIRDTGNAKQLVDLYDVIPRIDRFEFDASLSLEEDDSEDVPDAVDFDIVAFDKMGDPLVVITLNDARDPAPRSMLESLEADASAVAANRPELAGAFLVTASFFEPGALEVTEEATSGGFLSRDSRLSFVNVTRKTGYHICLVEGREDGFHVTVPDL